MIKIQMISLLESKNRGKGWSLEYGFADTPFGRCFVAATSCGICSFQFADQNEAELLSAFKEEWKEALHIQNDEMPKALISNVLTGYSQPLTLHIKGTPFQVKVWETLLAIPTGSVVSYSELAQLAGKEKAVRAVASAVARNPIGFIIPCHRVIRKEGIVGQYHWGSERKTKIIAWERTQRDIISQ